MANNAVFIDCWGWTAMGHRRDPNFSKVSRFYRGLRDKQVPIYTSDYVLDEFITLVFRRESYDHIKQFLEAVLASEADSQLSIERVNQERFLAAWELRKRYRDKPRISFTDLTSMVIMSELGIEQVLTEDEHFTHVGMGFLRVP